MEQRTINTILAALRYWEEALVGKRTTRGSILDIASDGNRLPLSHQEVNSLCEAINENGLRLMTDDRDIAQPIFSLVDQGFSIKFAAYGPTKKLEIVIEEEKGETLLRVYTRKHRSDAVLSLLSRAMHMRGTT